MDEIKIHKKFLSGKLKWRPRRRREDNIRIDLREIRWEGVWTGFIWLRTRNSNEMLWTR